MTWTLRRQPGNCPLDQSQESGVPDGRFLSILLKKWVKRRTAQHEAGFLATDEPLSLVAPGI
jgi:hypothetical protein